MAMIVFDGVVARSAPAYHAALRRLEDGALTDTTTQTSSRAGPSETHLPHPAGPSQAQTARALLPPAFTWLDTQKTKNSTSWLLETHDPNKTETLIDE